MVMMLAGAIFTAVGIPFFIIGVLFALFENLESDPSLVMFPIIFIGLGGIAAVVGIALIVYYLKGQKHKRYLMEHGAHVFATVVDIVDDYSIQINGRPGYKVILVYVDPITQVEHGFESDTLIKHKPSIRIGTNHKVFYDVKHGYDDYVVDI